MRPSLPSAFDDLKTLSQISYVIDGEGKLITVTRKDQSKQSLNIPNGGHAKAQDITLPPARKLREEPNWYVRLLTGKPF